MFRNFPTLIQISKPRSTKKTKREETPASSAIERLTSEIVNFRAHSSTDQLRDLRDTLPSDELSMLEHQAKLVDFAEKYAEYLEKKEAGLIQTENFILAIREKAYANCNAQVKSLEKQIESTKREIAIIESTGSETPETSDSTISSTAVFSRRAADIAREDEESDMDDDVHPGVNVSQRLADEEVPEAEEFE